MVIVEEGFVVCSVDEGYDAAWGLGGASMVFTAVDVSVLSRFNDTGNGLLCLARTISNRIRRNGEWNGNIL